MPAQCLPTSPLRVPTNACHAARLPLANLALPLSDTYCPLACPPAADFKNVSIVGNYIKDRTKNAQFVIISLRNNMFELADRLVGIYK